MKKSILALIAVILGTASAHADMSAVERLGFQEGRRDGFTDIVSNLETYFARDLSAQGDTLYKNEIALEIEALRQKGAEPITGRTAEVLRASRGNNDYLIGFMDGSCQAMTEASTMNQERKTRYSGNMERYDAAEAIEARLTQIKRSEFNYCN